MVRRSKDEQGVLLYTVIGHTGVKGTSLKELPESQMAQKEVEILQGVIKTHGYILVSRGKRLEEIASQRQKGIYYYQ